MPNILSVKIAANFSLFDGSFSNMQIHINGNEKTFDADAMTVAELVQAMALAGKRIAIERNGEIVPKSQFDAVSITSGDKLEIVGAVGGG